MVGMNLRFSPLDYSASNKTFDFGGSNIVGANVPSPFLGEERYLVTAKTAANLFYVRLRDTHGIDTDDIYTSVALAHADMTADQGDVLYVTPGAHAVTAEVAWSKDNTHMVGLGGPTGFNDYSEAGCSIYTTTAAVAETVDLTGNHCSFRGLNFTNAGADTGNLAAFNVDGYDARFDGCSFHGVMNATQDGVAAAAALYIDTNGSWYDFTNCVIGDNNWQARTDANSGQLSYVSTAGYPAPQHGRFKDCRFNVRSETATCAAVRLPGLYCIDGPHLFEGCMFHNTSTNWVNTLNQVFYNGNIQTSRIILKDCGSVGFTEWQTTDWAGLYFCTSGIAHKNGGTGVEAVT